MTRDYNQEIAAYRRLASHIGHRKGMDVSAGFSPAQRKRFGASNICSPDRIEYRVIGKGKALVEISHGAGFGGGHLFGLTVFCYGDDSRDHELSCAASSAEEAAQELARLHQELSQ